MTPTSKVQRGAVTAPRRIVLVEDEPLVAMATQTIIEAIGGQVCGVAATVQEALAIATTERPEIVLMDILLLGEGDGIAAAEELYVCLGIPVIFVTALSDPETLDRARSSGAYGLVTKPYTKSTLGSAIEMAIAKHNELRQSIQAGRWQQNILAELDTAFVATDRSGVAHYMNPAAHRLLGWSSLSAAGQPIGKVLGVETSPPWSDAELRSLKPGDVLQYKTGAEGGGQKSARALRVKVVVGGAREQAKGSFLLWTISTGLSQSSTWSATAPASNDDLPERSRPSETP